ncbi:MAG TPA: rod shape-determining protein RodA [Rickettsiales bacterium]|nr:rod shape-determining protein RodA [Rickettsiales bacterium]
MNNFFSFAKIFEINKNFFIFLVLIFVIGIFTLYSAANGSFSPWAGKQIMYFICFLPIASIIVLLDINIWCKFSYIIYLIALLLLVYVEFSGHTAMGATRWIKIAGFSLQPSETMKLGLVIGLARYFSEKNIKEIKKNRNLIIPLIMILTPAMLVLKQPDLGTSFILIAIGGSIFFLVGVQWWKFTICFLLFASSIPFAWKYVLHDYQKKRFEVFLNPESDPLGSGYNITQSKIAIGSGGFFGKGYLKGTQSQLAFLPEKQTDFIFTTYTEEMGFIGGLFIIILYLVLITFIFWLSLKSKYTYGRVIIAGVGFIIFFHVFINIGMVMGLLPVVGVPLPLFSYGGSITVISLLSFSFLLNADLYRETEIKNKRFF